MSATTAIDVAAFILAEAGPMDTIRLQKLTYYSQAWSLVWFGKPLFLEEFEAWANGPVCRELYMKHRGRYKVDGVSGGDVARIDAERMAAIRGVLKFYGKFTAEDLSELTHIEAPWRVARGATAPNAPSRAVISRHSMRAYYSSLR